MAQTSLTLAPPQPITERKAKLSAEVRENIGRALYSSVRASMSDRAGLDEDLVRWQNLYEQRTYGRDHPWPDAADVFVPLIPRMVDTLASQIAASVITPRFYLVSGNTPEAARTASDVERYYNTELWRHRWDETHYQWLHTALRDGTAILETLWKTKRTRRKYVIVDTMKDPESGMPIPDMETGQPMLTTKVEEAIITEYDDVSLEVVRLKDFLIIPSWQYSIEDAPAVGRILWLSEADLKAMVASGELWDDAVEEALAKVHEGHSERGADEQGTDDISLAGKVLIGEEQGSPASTLPQQRGPIQVIRIHSRQFDVDGTGDFQEYVFWLAYKSQKLLGYDVYKYWHGKRPFVDLTPMPRPGLFYGFSVPGRLDSLQVELNANENQRLDMINLYLSPPLIRLPGAIISNKSQRWGPGVVWDADTKDAITKLEIGDVPSSTWLESDKLWKYAEELMGLGAPMSGLVGTTGRRTKAEVQAAQAAATVRVNLMAARMRQAAREVFWQIHQLKLQYGPDEVQTNQMQEGIPKILSIPKVVLAQDYTHEIAGSGGPLDKATRMQEILFLYDKVMQNPDVGGDPIHRYRFLRMVLEQFDLPDIVSLIGTEEEAVQRAQQMQMQQLAAQAGGGQPGAQGQGQPGGQGAGGMV